MPELILHHYWESPYSEKIRRIMGLKGLAWKSVVIPIVMPKPDLLALTGGYRKTPVLQVGADIYCDTDCIVDFLERIRPEPSLYPGHSRARCHMLSGWAQEVFMLVINVLGGSGGDVFPEGFVEDRTTMIEGGIDLARMLAQLPARRDQLRVKIELLEEHLGDGRSFILGEEPSLADFGIHHPVFLLRMLPATAPILEPFEQIKAWMERMDRFGHGDRTDIDSKEAIAIARSATPVTEVRIDPQDPNGRRPGERVEVVHQDLGRDPVIGELVASSAREIAIRRSGERVGEVVVHFPRQYYLVLPAGG
jgi:glutathione S-transferase